MAIRNILVPIDFSPHASRALDLAIEFARPLGAEIHLLHAVFFRQISGFPEPIGVPREFLDRAVAEAWSLLEPLKERVAKAGLRAHSHVSEDEPTTAIAELASSIPADLIAMGTRGLTGLKHVLLGSVAERTVRLAPCPVLTVQADPR